MRCGKICRAVTWQLSSTVLRGFFIVLTAPTANARNAARLPVWLNSNRYRCLDDSSETSFSVISRRARNADERQLHRIKQAVLDGRDLRIGRNVLGDLAALGCGYISDSVKALEVTMPFAPSTLPLLQALRRRPARSSMCQRFGRFFRDGFATRPNRFLTKACWGHCASRRGHSDI